MGQRLSDNAVLPKKTMWLLRHIQSRQSNSRLTPAAGVNPTRPKRNYLPLESERKKAITFDSIVGRCEPSIRLHVVARHYFIGVCDEAT